MDTDLHQYGKQTGFRSGFVAIVGAPNVGKSTLLNQLLGEKVAITTPKPQTTRRQVKGILTGDKFQIVFVDTPGIHESNKPLNKILVRWATQALADVDAAVFVVDATRRHRGQEFAILDLLKKVGQPVVLVLNKIDRVAKETLLPIIAELKDAYPFEAIVPISAKYESGAYYVLDEILRLLSEGPQYFNGAIITDQSRDDLVAEFIREKIFLLAEQEIPYSTAVNVEEIEDNQEQRITKIFATIFVEKQSQKGIIIGKNGRFIKKIGIFARDELESLWGKKVHMDLRVRVLKDWSRDDRALRRLGLTT
ncbi:MAG: GTPase Era [Thermodesulfobacteriota bacterium]|nr:MAG: GTPase Era [Thermodesulfobacteriota bacterium]